MRALLLVLMCVLPVPALALSCLAPSVERSFAQFDAAEETYVVVHGRLTLDEKKLPKNLGLDRKPPRLTILPGRLRGSSLTKAGFVLPFDQELSLEVSCIGPWCGSARNGEDALAFVRKDADGYALAISPCGGAVFGNPKPEMLKQVRTCLRTGTCTAD
ncbi:hypothetical protein GV827_05260 [Sulfitobacter sp. JBTF-M27]|uniref:Uncharacterized protein n=1 Tax=Sulfitobacter sediminilitoris TaxID=2698830 RepID=A0A6P0C6L7_9RHOB|nr:hypothetical protein [Sulfitobacter sediminilitoris]NEK21809.1 hypothetical protein [Sulfitobacter sediminilitoris]